MPDDARPGPHYPALLQLLRSAETIWNASRVFFARWDLSPAQFNLLNLLHGEGQGLNQSDLSRFLLTHRSNVTGLVDRLEQRGLVRRKAEAGDRRAWRVDLTPAGTALVREILPGYFRGAETVWKGIPASRANAIAADLQRVTANTEAALEELQRRARA